MNGAVPLGDGGGGTERQGRHSRPCAHGVGCRARGGRAGLPAAVPAAPPLPGAVQRRRRVNLPVTASRTGGRQIVGISCRPARSGDSGVGARSLAESTETPGVDGPLRATEGESEGGQDNAHPSYGPVRRTAVFITPASTRQQKHCQHKGWMDTEMGRVARLNMSEQIGV